MIAAAIAEDVVAKRRREIARQAELRALGWRSGQRPKVDWASVQPAAWGQRGAQARALGVSRKTFHTYFRCSPYRPSVALPDVLPDLPVKDLAHRYGVHVQTMYRILRERRTPTVPCLSRDEPRRRQSSDKDRPATHTKPMRLNRIMATCFQRIDGPLAEDLRVALQRLESTTGAGNGPSTLQE